ncbi:MAG: hypothetical protein K2X48_13805 [Chitinophagaceae bacterium]|nr:hypothetical protein [Chitinophagaceae bacterium]
MSGGDDFNVSITNSNILEENHYYSYGLRIAGISSKRITDSYDGLAKNNYQYNDKELWDDADLNWYDYGFRNYDPQIGRFTQLDPLTDDYPFLTPYQYGSCDPILNIDIDGLEGVEAVKELTEIVVTGTRASAKVVSEVSLKIGEEIIKQAFKKAPQLLGLGLKAASLTIFLVVSPNFDSPAPHNEFSDSHYEKMEEINNKYFTQTLTDPNKTAPANPPKEKKKPEKRFYVTYTKTKVNPDGSTTIYSGRTSGTYKGNAPTREDAQKAIKRRDASHTDLRNDGYGSATLDKYSKDYAAIRGREQQLIDFHGGAQSEGGRSGNRIRGVGRGNKLRKLYDNASTIKFKGKLPNNNPADKIP